MTCNTLYSDGTGISGHSPTPRRESIESLAKHIRLLVLDVDGVMTDGGLYYDAKMCIRDRYCLLHQHTKFYKNDMELSFNPEGYLLFSVYLSGY